MKEQDILVVGGGLVGSLLALLLGQRGHKVSVLERRPDMRRADIPAGRSINLALSDRGWRALKLAGIDDEIREIALPMRGRRMHGLDGALSFQPYHEDGRTIFSVSRGELNKRLMTRSEEHDKVEFFFEQRVERVDFEARTVHMRDGTLRTADVILGTDGAFSAVRLSMMLSPLKLSYSQDYLDHGYKELTIPPNADGGHVLDDDCLHIWPRGDFMMIGLPNPAGDFTGTLFMRNAGEGASFEALDSRDKVRVFFEENFADAIALMPNYLDEFERNPVGELCTIRCSPWNYEDKACLLGDASHAIVPFYGQGMNAGFEDCTRFIARLDTMFPDETAPDWRAFFDAFFEDRKDDADAIADLALYNYVEMRDRVADPKFLKRKTIEGRISKIFGADYEPLYSMVTFSHRPYSEAKRLGDLHEQMMQTLMDTIDDLDDLDDGALRELVERARQSP